MQERTWAGGKEPGRTLSHPQGARAAAAMVTSASCLIHLKQQKGGCWLPARAGHRCVGLFTTAACGIPRKRLQTGHPAAAKYPGVRS